MTGDKDTFYDAYAAAANEGDGLFGLCLVLCLTAFFGLGAYLKTVKPSSRDFAEAAIQAINTSFVMEQKKAPPKPPPPKIEKPKDLTRPAILAQKEDAAGKPASQAGPRPVYGLRKVYSIGLGSGGGGDAVIGKLGNTLDKEVDTIKATSADLKGVPVSVTTVTIMPSIKTGAKPEYSELMKKNGVQGVIAAKILIDIDGKVKQVILLNDLGFGSKEAALDAFWKLEFAPAMQGDKPVAVWIIMKFKFVLQEQ